MVVDNSLSLALSRSLGLSPHIASVCKEARETTFGPEQLLQQYKDGVVGHRKDGRREVASLLIPSQQYSGLSRCAQLSYEDTEACLCVLDSCIQWYPCSLKYCR